MVAVENGASNSYGPKYVCAPCSNCKGAIRDLLRHYQAGPKVGIHYGGLAELIVNAMADVKPGFVNFEAV